MADIIPLSLSIIQSQNIPTPTSNPIQDGPDTSSILHAALAILANPVANNETSTQKSDSSSVLHAALAILANQSTITPQSTIPGSLAQASNGIFGANILANLFTFSEVTPKRRAKIITEIAQEISNSTAKTPSFLTTHIPIFDTVPPYRIVGYKSLVGDTPVTSVEDVREAIEHINQLKQDVLAAKNKL